MSKSKSDRADVQVFAKASRFGSFLKDTVGDMPSPEAAATGDSDLPSPAPAIGKAPGFTVSLFFTFAVPITSMSLLSWC